MENNKLPPQRPTYRHGDLRRALLEYGLELARERGPEAVTLREATRMAGVAPNAAYRHFANHQALLGAVVATAVGQVARMMEEEVAAVAEQPGTPSHARACLRAVGRGYLRFAREEPNLFRTAFMTYVEERDSGPATFGATGRPPRALLEDALDRMVESGALPRERRIGADIAAWAGVHGLACLIIAGPLKIDDVKVRRAIEERIIEMVERGL